MLDGRPLQLSIHNLDLLTTSNPIQLSSFVYKDAIVSITHLAKTDILLATGQKWSHEFNDRKHDLILVSSDKVYFRAPGYKLAQFW